MSVETTIRGIFDRLAKVRQNSLSIASGGSDFWARVDASGDEPFENRVKGQAMTDVDTDLATGLKLTTPTLRPLVTLIESYLSLDLGYTGTPKLKAYLDAVGGWRVPYEAANCIWDALGSALATYQVGGKGTLVADGSDPSNAGMHHFGDLTAPSTFVAVDGALNPVATGIVGVPVMAVNLSASQTAGATFTCTQQSGTTITLTVSYSSAAQYTQEVLGEQAVSSTAASGQKVVSVSATTQFKVGEYVLIYESDALQQVAQVASIQPGTSLTMQVNLRNSFTTAAKVWPLFTNVAYASGGTGTGGISLYGRPDRVIAE